MDDFVKEAVDTLVSGGGTSLVALSAVPGTGTLDMASGGQDEVFVIQAICIDPNVGVGDRFLQVVNLAIMEESLMGLLEGLQTFLFGSDSFITEGGK